MTFLRILYIAFGIVLLATFLFLAYIFRTILAPFLIGYILLFALRPFVNMLSIRGMRRTTAVLTVFFGAFFLCAVILWFIIPAMFRELVTVQENITLYTSILIGKINEFKDILSRGQGFFATYLSDQAVIDKLLAFISGYISSFLGKLSQNLFSLLNLIIYLSVIPFATFFFLYDEGRIHQKIISLVPNRSFEIPLNILYSLNQQAVVILKGMLISVAIISVLSIVGLWIIGLDYPIIIGLFAGVANLIPYFGPIVGVAAGLIVALLTGKPFVFFLSVILVFLIIQLLDNVLVQPLVFSKAANLHPLVVIFLVLAGSKIGGLLGMLLIVPLASLLNVVTVILFRELRRPLRPDFSKYVDRREHLVKA